MHKLSQQSARIEKGDTKASSTGSVGIGVVVLILSLVTARGLPGQEQAARQPSGAVIPAISGRVVDAITGKPLAGVDVTMRAETADRKQLRYENHRTSPTGRFEFPSSMEPKAAALFDGIGEISITVNIPSVSVARIRAAPSNDWVTSDGGSDASQKVLWDPLFITKSSRVYNLELKGPRVNNRAYFPMAVQFLRACGQAWNANCISMDATRDVRVLLIPMLDDPATCRKIPDRDLHEGCRELQTYRAAFRHVETMAEVRADKSLCNSIDGGRVSKLCLNNLFSYIVSPKRYESRPPLRTEIDPVEEALILAPIAGMPVASHGLAGADPFHETATYFAHYRRQTRWPLLDTAAVMVEFIGDTEARRRRFASYLTFNPGITKEAGHLAMFDGSPLFMLERKGTDTSDVLWTSGDRLIMISFRHAADYVRGGSSENDARMAEATPELRRELIRSYLRKYPVSN